MGKVSKRKSKGSSYFDPLINQFNGDIFKANERQLKDRMPLLIRDISRGNVSYERYNKYFTDKLIYWLADTVVNEYNNAVFDRQAYYEFSINHPDNNWANVKLARATERVKAYATLMKQTNELYAQGPVYLETALRLIAVQMNNNYKFVV